MKPKGTISQLKVTGSLSQLEVKGSLSQLSINGELVQSGYTFAFTEAEAPTLLVATASGYDQINLTWQDNSERELGFSIERSTDGVEFAELDTVAVDVESYSDTTCEESTEYWYRVRAYRGEFYSGYSNTDSDTTPSAFVYDADLLTYIDGLETELSEAQLLKIDTFLKTLKAGLGISALSDAFDVINIYANETEESSLRNLVKRAHDSSLRGTPTWTEFEGYEHNYQSQGLNINWSFIDDAVNPTINSMAIGLYNRKDALSNTIDMHIDTTTPAGFDWLFSIKQSDGRTRWMAFIGSSRYKDNANNSLGLYSISRTASNLSVINRNGTNYDSIPNTPANIIATPAIKINLIAGRQVSFAYISRGLSATEMLVLFNAVEAYMDANDKGVI